jgi:drug/metabolite transporter (DMT)-like permease
VTSGDDTASFEHAHRRAVVLAVVVTFLWSSSWVMVRWAIDDHGMSPILGAGLRYLLACLVLASVVSVTPRDRRDVRLLGRRDLVALLVLGLVFYAVTQGAQVIAIASQPAATTSLVLSFTPLLVALVSQASLGERPTSSQLVGAAAIGLGALLYLSGDLGMTALGMVAAIACLFANVVSSVLGRAVNRSLRLSSRVVTTTSMTAGAVALVVVGLAVEGPPRLDPEGWLLVAWMAVVNTALAFTWWNESLRHLSATESSAINNLMLLQIAALAWLLLGEVPGVIQWIGMALVTLGVLAARASRTVADQPPMGSLSMSRVSPNRTASDSRAGASTRSSSASEAPSATET